MILILSLFALIGAAIALLTGNMMHAVGTVAVGACVALAVCVPDYKFYNRQDLDFKASTKPTTNLALALITGDLEGARQAMCIGIDTYVLQNEIFGAHIRRFIPALVQYVATHSGTAPQKPLRKTK